MANNNTATNTPSSDKLSFLGQMLAPWKHNGKRGLGHLKEGGERFAAGAESMLQAGWNKVTGMFDSSAEKGLPRRMGEGMVQGVNKMAANAIGLTGRLVAAPFKTAGGLMQKHKIVSTVLILFGVTKIVQWWKNRQAKKDAAAALAEEQRHGRELHKLQRAVATEKDRLGLNGVGYGYEYAPQPPTGHQGWEGYLDARGAAAQQGQYQYK